MTTQIKGIALGLFAASLVFVGPACAVQLNLSCATAAEALSSDDRLLEGTVVGLGIGAAGMIGDLLCFVADPRCTCLRNVTNSDSPRNDQFAAELGRILASCRVAAPNRTMSGIGQEAALRVCF